MNRSSLVSGPVFGGLVRFSLPMIIINILQMLFHMADTAILGIMAGDAEVAAVGACGFLITSCWAWFVWPLRRTLPFLFVCFPLSAFVGTVIYMFVYKSAIKKESTKVGVYGHE